MIRLTHDVRHDVSAPQTLRLIDELADQFQQHGIAYVHWKSNIHLSRALAGIDDLDLLVDRASAGAALSVLCQLGFRQAYRQRTVPIPGITHYFGLDRDTGQMVHVHLHLRLVVGHDLTKNFHLPVESAVVASAQHDTPLPTPAPEVEMILYVLRMVLKCTWRRNHLRAFDQLGQHVELDYHLRRSDSARAREWLSRYLPCVTHDLFFACVQAAQVGTTTWQRMRVRGQLHRALQPHGRQLPTWDACLKMGRRLQASAARRLRWTTPGKQLAGGGMVLAVVGGDGSGKSTLVNRLEQHFRRHLTTDRVHMGKPPRSWLTRSVELISKAVRRIASAASTRPASASNPEPLTFWQLTRAACLARDRYRLYRRVRRSAACGWIVLCDRWPVAGLKQMDSPPSFVPNSATSIGAASPVAARLAQWLTDRAQWYHQQILPPDRMLVLRVPPDVAVARAQQRGGSMRESQLRARSEEAWQFSWNPHTAHVIDGQQDVEQVAREAIAAVWERLN